jgi:hypothetical protein
MSYVLPTYKPQSQSGYSSRGPTDGGQGPTGYVKWSPGYEGFIGSHLQDAFQGFGNQMQGAMGQMGSILQGNAERAAADRESLRGVTSRMGMLPFDITPPTHQRQIVNGLPGDFNDWLDMNAQMKSRMGEAQSKSPLYRDQLGMMKGLLAALFPGAAMGVQQQQPSPAFTTNFGAYGGFS